MDEKDREIQELRRQVESTKIEPARLVPTGRNTHATEPTRHMGRCL